MEYSFRDFSIIRDLYHKPNTEGLLNTKVELRVAAEIEEEKDMYAMTIIWEATSYIYEEFISAFAVKANGFVHYQNTDTEAETLLSAFQRTYEVFEEAYYEFIKDKKISVNKLPTNEHLSLEEIGKYISPMQQRYHG